MLLGLKVDRVFSIMSALVIFLPHCQMVRSGQPTGVLIPVVYLFGGEESKAKNSKVAHEYAEHREHGEFILFGPLESNTLRPIIGVDCLRIAYEYKGSPRPPYIGQWTRSVPRLLVGYDQETYVYITHLAISRQSALVVIHRGLVLYTES
jgi:hypothetical protein